MTSTTDIDDAPRARSRPSRASPTSAATRRDHAARRPDQPRLQASTTGRGALLPAPPGKGTEEYINRARRGGRARERGRRPASSPEVLHFDPATGVMVTRFIDGAVDHVAGAVRDARRAPSSAPARAFRQLHDSGAAVRLPLRAVRDDRRLSQAARRPRRSSCPRAITRSSREAEACARRSPRIPCRSAPATAIRSARTSSIPASACGSSTGNIPA